LGSARPFARSLEPSWKKVTLVSSLSARELEEIEVANRSGRPVVVFVHGMFIHASSWSPWCSLFEGAGYATIAPGWPEEPGSVAEARAHMARARRQDLRAVLEHHRAVVASLDQKPALVGHCAGGWVVQRLASEGLASVTVAMEPTPFRGILQTPISAVRSTLPVVARPRHYRRAMSLTFEQFRYSWANAVDADEARFLYERHHVPAPGAALFQSALANVNPWSPVRIALSAPERGPLLLIAGTEDRQATWSLTHAAYQRHQRNPAPTEIVEMANRGHTMPYDQGWAEVAALALTFIERHVPTPPIQVSP
jgi:non-heme chloroperoxidase